MLAANRAYAATFALQGLAGVAARGVGVVTCMDSRLDPLQMLGLDVGDAKILRTPGAHVTPDALVGCVLGTQLLGVTRIMIIAHTRCAMAQGDDHDIARAIKTRNGLDVGDMTFGADPDQTSRLEADVALVAEHPLIKGRAEVGGFVYDVDTGVIDRVV